ncbi:ABC transporter [candidate division BRC1 bacterium HGW-BRC1-1]|jgi:ABC-2 type transport system permease protein|nr:MAG: ABC transporter [candidate division BRC1 bacterium HGW-BRC1-1]
MANIYRIFKKEVGGYMNSASAYVFLIVFLALGATLFFTQGGFFLNRQASMGGFFVFVPWLFLFFVPAIAMRIWAEEKKAGTEELLMTMPVRDYEVVMGKYLAALLLLVVALLLTFPLPLTVRHFADPKTPVDWGPVAGGYTASILFGAMVLAIGTWSSSLTRNQIIAFILGCAITFVTIVLGFPAVYEVLPFGQFLASLSPWTRYVSMYSGAISLADVVYYLSAVALFLYLNIRTVESRKWM